MSNSGLRGSGYSSLQGLNPGVCQDPAHFRRDGLEQAAGAFPWSRWCLDGIVREGKPQLASSICHGYNRVSRTWFESKGVRERMEVEDSPVEPAPNGDRADRADFIAALVLVGIVALIGIVAVILRYPDPPSPPPPTPGVTTMPALMWPVMPIPGVASTALSRMRRTSRESLG